jgi:ribulose-phosphate 3-epimerase
MALVAPSILSADFARLGDELESVLAAGADWIHVDVMDGRFVPNLTIGPLIVEAVKRVVGDRAPIDVHLMIVEPEKYVEAFRAAGADWITVHAEAVTHLHRAVHQLRDLGAKAGVSLNPHTPPDVLDYVLEDLDLVLVMSVNPGFGGQSLIEGAFRKLAWLRERRGEAGQRPAVHRGRGPCACVGLRRVRGRGPAGGDRGAAGELTPAAYLRVLPSHTPSAR